MTTDYFPDATLTGGRWVTGKHGIKRWIAPPRPGPVPKPYILTKAERKEAHRRYAAGDREPLVVIGEREYQRASKRATRAARRAMVA